MSTDKLELAIVRVIEELIKLKRENRKVGKKKLWVKTWILRMVGNLAKASSCIAFVSQFIVRILFKS